MGRRIKWLIAVALPLLAACSSFTGITKKAPEIPKKTQATFNVAAKDGAASAEGDGAFHIVGKGETLQHICEVYGLDFDKVAKINNIRPPHTLAAGETVFLPAQALLPEKRGGCGKKIEGAGASGERKESGSLVANAIRGVRDPAVPTLKFPIPSGVLSSPFGFRWGKFHKGLDISAPVGRSVLACADGRVIFTGSRKKFRRYGNTVLIDHGKGVYTYYAHLKDILVKKNQPVRRGQLIARVGNTGRSTGPHLHLEVRVANMMHNPLAYFSPSELNKVSVASGRFNKSPMGPVRAGWRIPDLLSARH
jgi:lipoprotein NlpD